jgi:hypothetical protein
MKIRVFATALCAVLISNVHGAQQDLGWDPAHTWIFAVGVLHWKHNEMFGSFPVKERRDAEFVDFFKEHGVPAKQIVYLQDQRATQHGIDAALADQLKEIPKEDLLIVYYAGHGSKRENGKDVYLASYDAGDKNVPGWSVNSIPKAIDANCAGQRVLWFIDCCYSGQAARAIANSAGPPAYACVTSSSASESSTGHWTFTEALLDALGGAGYVDLNHDGVITLAEFASHAHADMALGEEQLSTFATAGGFDQQMVLSRASKVESPRVGERGEIQWHADWWPVRVVQDTAGKLKVHYIGYSAGDDLWVTPDKLRPIKPVQYAIGSKVDVLWKTKWYPAKILKVEDGIHLIHYVDYDASWDEWVSSKRIRPVGPEVIRQKQD